jgi:hypothetical protein
MDIVRFQLIQRESAYRDLNPPKIIPEFISGEPDVKVN